MKKKSILFLTFFLFAGMLVFLMPVRTAAASEETEEETTEAAETPTPAPKPIPLQSVTLKYGTLAYNGTARTQTKSLQVTAIVDGAEKILKKGTDYTVRYENNINAGKASVIVKGIGSYSGTITKTFKITPAEIRTLTIKYKTLLYTGAARKQTKSAVVKAVVNGETRILEKGTDYTVSYSGDIIGPGPVYLVAKGCGNYTGTLKKLYKIIPKGTSIQSLTPATRRVTVKWGKLPAITDGCQIQYSTSPDFSSGVKSVKVAGNTKTSKTITGLTAGKTYYFRVRTYSLVRKTSYYSDWSAAKNVELEKNVLSTKGETGGKRTLILDNAPTKLTSVEFAVWSKANGQDDLKWIKAKKDSTGRWTAAFSVKKFRNAGTFYLHAYGNGEFLTGRTFKVKAAEVETEYTRLAASLKASKKNDQLILVGATGTECVVTMLNKNDDGTWYQLLTTSGNVGKNGIGEVTEWNRKTPVGLYTITDAFGIYEDPGCAIPYVQVDDSYYWVDDVDSVYYNRFVSTNTTPVSWNSGEHIIDYIDYYQYCLAMDFNKECVSGAGSAIFLHVGDGSPTLGCIGVPFDMMEKIMKYVRPGCKIIIDTPGNLKNY